MKNRSSITFLILLVSVMIATDVSARVRIIIRPWRPQAIVVRPFFAPLPRVVPRRLPPPPRTIVAKGLLTLDIRPADSAVFIDDIYQGNAAYLTDNYKKVAVKPGSHNVTLSRDGYKTEQFIVEVYSGQITELDVTLRPVYESDTEQDPDETAYKLDLEGTGDVLFKITPDDASIYIDDAFYGIASKFLISSEAIVLRKGKHKIHIVRPGYIDHTTTIEVGGEKVKEIHVTLQQKKR